MKSCHIASRYICYAPDAVVGISLKKIKRNKVSEFLASSLTRHGRDDMCICMLVHLLPGMFRGEALIKLGTY